MNLEKIFHNNETWIQEKFSIDKDYFKNLSNGQNPKVL